jgi:hypothetical protein
MCAILPKPLNPSRAAASPRVATDGSQGNKRHEVHSS